MADDGKVKKVVAPILAGVAGAAAGAATVALMDKDNRKKVKDVLVRAGEAMVKAQEQSTAKAEKAVKKLTSSRKKS